MRMRRPGWLFINLLTAAFALAAAPAGASVLITIDKSMQQMTVSVDGAPRWQWLVSTGKRGYDTPSGKYRTFRMEAEHFSREWDDAPMPHSIFFTRKGHAIHGYLNTRNIGRPASHGCVRLEPANAKMLFALVKREGLQNTEVVLTGSLAQAQRNLHAGKLPWSQRAHTTGNAVSARARPPGHVLPPAAARPPRAVPPPVVPPINSADAGRRPVIFPLFGLFVPPVAPPPSAQYETFDAPRDTRR